ncbi:MAG: HAMP domain-containing sensor histidine kinase [Myxococcota bacterium]
MADDPQRTAKGILHPEGMQAARDLAVGVVHEMNNVLGVIVGNAHLALKDGARPDAISRYLREIKAAAEDGREVMRQLSALSGDDPSHSHVVSLNDLAHQLARECTKTVERALSSVEPKVRVDLWLAQGTLGNVARLLTEAQSVTRLRVSTRILGAATMLIFEDDGPPPSDSELASLFAPFAKLAGRPKTGLELTKLAHLAERAGGHVAGARLDPRGIRLVLTLPLATDVPSGDGPGVTLSK